MRVFIIAILAAGLMSCGSYTMMKEARKATYMEHWDQAFKLWQDFLKKDPRNKEAQIQLERARLNAALTHLQKANYYFKNNNPNEADLEAQMALAYDPANQSARDIRDNIALRKEKERAARENKGQMGSDAGSQMPSLTPNTWGPVNLYFNKPTDIHDIYTSMGRAYDINMLIDPGIRSKKMTLDLRKMDFLKALEALMILNKHFYRIIDDNTIIILNDDKTTRDRNENKVVKTFYLSNITPKDLKNHLRVLGDFKDFAENEELNAITIKGTPEQVAVAEKIIAANDKAQAEVLVEIELLEVNRNKVENYGLLPISPVDGSRSYQAGIIASPTSQDDDADNANGLRGFFPSLDSTDILTLVPAVVINFLKESGDTKQVANPQMRVTAGTEAKITIGQQIPIASTQFTNGQLSGPNSGGSRFGDQALTTFNYNDVGISITIKPRVHHNEEITLEVELEIKSVVSQGFQPTLSQRKVNTTIRLKNGETNVLAGLLTNEERESLTGIIGLTDIPILGKLFSNTDKQISQTDIVMTLKPIIVRGPNITDEDRASYEVSNLRLSTLAKMAKKEQEQDQDQDQDQEGGSRTPLDSEDEPPPVPSYHGEQDEPPSDQAPNVFQPKPFDYPKLQQPTTPQPEDAEATEESKPSNQDEEPEGPQDEELSPAMVSFMPPQSEARQDEELEVQAFIANVPSMTLGDFSIQFNPAIVQVESVTLGGFFNSGFNNPILKPSWNNEEGLIRIIAQQRDGKPPFSGMGIMAQIKFRAVAPGSSGLTFSQILIRDEEGNPLPSQGLEASIEIAP